MNNLNIFSINKKIAYIVCCIQLDYEIFSPSSISSGGCFVVVTYIDTDKTIRNYI